MKTFISVGILAALLCGCTSFEEIKQQANAGDPEKQYEVALMYRDGNGTPANHDKYNEYITKAARNGNLPAAWNLVRTIAAQKDLDKANDFIFAYKILLTTHSGNYENIHIIYDAIDSIGIEYLRQLVRNNRPEAIELRTLFQKNLSRKYLSGRKIIKLQRLLATMKSPAEIAEQKRKEAEQKRREAEQKRKEAEQKRKEAEQKLNATVDRLVEEENKKHSIPPSYGEYNSSDAAKSLMQWGDMNLAEEIRKTSAEIERYQAKYDELKGKILKWEDSDVYGEAAIQHLAFYKYEIRKLNKHLELCKKEVQRRIAEAKRLEEKRIAEEPFAKAKYPLKGKAHTPIKLYKNLFSGIPYEFFKDMSLDEKKQAVRNYKLFWDSIIIPVKKNGVLLSLKERYINDQMYQHTLFAFFNQKKQFKVLDLPRYSDSNYELLTGITFNYRISDRVSIQSLIDKFKKEYPELKQTGSATYENFVRASKKLHRDEIAEIEREQKRTKESQYFYVMEDKDGILASCASPYLPKLEFVKIVLCNDNVQIELEGEYYDGKYSLDLDNKIAEVTYKLKDIIKITITDVKLKKYCTKIRKEIMQGILEYNKKWSKKQTEIDLDF